MAKNCTSDVTASLFTSIVTASRHQWCNPVVLFSSIVQPLFSDFEWDIIQTNLDDSCRPGERKHQGVQPQLGQPDDRPG